MDNNEITALVSLGFRKAFNVTNHKLLLENFIYRVGNCAVSLFGCYLLEGIQFVKAIFLQMPVVQGVPQRSVLVHVNCDMANSIN